MHEACSGCFLGLKVWHDLVTSYWPGFIIPVHGWDMGFYIVGKDLHTLGALRPLKYMGSHVITMGMLGQLWAA